MKHIKLLFSGILLLITQFATSQNLEKTQSQFTIASQILNEIRTCLISVPESYYDASNADKTYPIIVLLDGAVHFKATSATASFMSSERNRNYLMPETIVIAIENVDRERDFTVTKIKTKRKNTMGGGKKFLNFIQQELIPYIDKNYRTETHRTLIGHSLGGLLSLNAYIDQNNLFDAYLVIDPSIWWNEEMMKAKVDSITTKSYNKKLYIATANQNEANYERNKKRHDSFYELVKAKTEIPNNIMLETFEDENHRSVPLIAIYKGLKYLNQ